jgi:uncharacterized protein YacL
MTLKVSLNSTNPGLNSFTVYNPFVQAGLAAGFILGFLLLGLAIKSMAPGNMGARLPWITSTAMILLFAVFNSVFCLMAANATQYWNRSLISYLLLLGFGGLVAWLVSGIPISDAGSFKWLFMVISLSYLVFISIVNLIKVIVAFAEKEEWLAPRLRERKGRQNTDHE